MVMDIILDVTSGQEISWQMTMEEPYTSEYRQLNQRILVSFKRSLVIALVSGITGFLTIIVAISCGSEENYKEEKRKQGEIISNIGGKNDTELPVFDLKSILAATEDFSAANKLDERGFGPVYKGILPGNRKVTIKMLSKKSGQGHLEFMNELKLIAKLQHTNLVRLLGCCIEEEERLLIYEYMPNRSLDKFLFDPYERTKLDWDRRFRIIEGIGQGLLYIHKYSRLKIIHRDLKAINILLDEAMNPKISDFGMARIFDIIQSEANSNRAWKLWKKGRGMEVIDESVRETCRPLEALRSIHGFLCVQEAPADPPTMFSVVHMLQADESTTLPPSKEPAFSTHKNSSVASSSSQTSRIFSANQLTVSILARRSIEVQCQSVINLPTVYTLAFDQLNARIVLQSFYGSNSGVSA
ncbi:G-type lectin S-receptor-like serine/threonine-protein kinase B120 [Rosa chinensis]|uniref:G-type lectin S-receptor-like serine/threonine-protein kinase B120 n=1 Tax=Rosa chinensis TaxID=74649 RepID=UPI000D08B351|nr:G-type lectin S-receptor-like serine/threonine-protein kinase B120 [Rosa chinensis]